MKGLLDTAIADILGQPKEVDKRAQQAAEDEALSGLPPDAQSAFAALKAKEPPKAEVTLGAPTREWELDVDENKLRFAHELNFRGRPEAVIDRLRFFQGIARRAFKLTANRPALDLKAGRGEWMLLCKKDSIPATGFDRNPFNVETCDTALLDVKLGSHRDAFASVVDGTLGIISAFRLFEYLPYDEHILILAHAHRALAPGGVFLLESPNVEHPRTQQQWFVDPWRKSPLHPSYLVWLCKALNFDQVEQHRVNNGGEDFALIAHKHA